MTARIQDATVQPAVTEGVRHLFKAIYSGGVPRPTLELVHLRASQVNGCSACVEAGVTSAAQAGVSTDKLLAVAAAGRGVQRVARWPAVVWIVFVAWVAVCAALGVMNLSSFKKNYPVGFAGIDVQRAGLARLAEHLNNSREIEV